MSTWCSKQVQEYNKSYYKTRFCASSWLVTNITLRCKVSKTSKFGLIRILGQVLTQDFTNFLAIWLCLSHKCVLSQLLTQTGKQMRCQDGRVEGREQDRYLLTAKLTRHTTWRLYISALLKVNWLLSQRTNNWVAFDCYCCCNSCFGGGFEPSFGVILRRVMWSAFQFGNWNFKVGYITVGVLSACCNTRYVCRCIM